MEILDRLIKDISNMDLDKVYKEIKKDPVLDVKTDTENKVSDLGSVALNIIHKLKPEFQEDALAYLLELSAKQRASEGKE